MNVLGWIQEHLAEITGFGNGLWLGLASVVFAMCMIILVMPRLHTELNSLAKALITGAALSSLGVFLNRSWWFVANLLYHETENPPDWAIEYRWIPMIAILFVFAGSWYAICFYLKSIRKPWIARIILSYIFIVAFAGWYFA